MSPRVRRGLWAAFALVTCELLFAIVSGAVSGWPPFGPLGPIGFTLRALVLAGLMAALRFRPLPLWLLLLPALAHFHLGGGRIGGDGVMYYVQLRSLLKDADIDLTNEYTHYELIDREDLRVRTKTGLRRSIFAIGPAVAWAPFFAAGEVVARGERAAGRDTDLSGYGPAHVNAVALGSFAYGFAALLLIHGLLHRHFSAGLATAGVLLLWAGSFLYWYMVHQPTMSHAPSAFGAALVIAMWDRSRGARTWRGHLALGLALGFAMCLRWQNGVLLVLPGFDLLRAAFSRTAGWRPLAAAPPRWAPARWRARCRRCWPGTRSTGCGCCPTRRTGPTSCASTIRTSWRRSSPRATACSRGRRSSGWASSGSFRSCAAAPRWPRRCWSRWS